ncbi:MAG TPA: hypothetical protein VM095_03075 [Pyrinomonadaceae bacterium]|nr:hypothetical protein [Pyrinomonadaceae bacterium]
MFNLGSTLDTAIALVVILLVLSLLVQAIQAFIKKIFKLKSKEIEKSLVILFQNIIDKPAAAPVKQTTTEPALVTVGAGAEGTGETGATGGEANAGAGGAAPAGTTADKPKAIEEEAKGFVKNVLDEFVSVGRYTKWGKPVLDSISKEDLLKILARVDSKHIYADYAVKFKGIYDNVSALEKAIKSLIDNGQLRGAASAQFAEMREVLLPLINDINAIWGDQGTNAKVVFGDLVNLRRIKLSDALGLLSQAQESVAKDLQAARQANKTAEITALETLSTKLTEIAGIISQLGQQADLAFAALRAKLDHVERWYDTVMQSFEERYTRQMKNFSIYISIAVVIYLNASFFRMYKSISTNDQQRTLIVKAGEQWLESQKEKSKPANANTTNAANKGQAGTTNTATGGNGNANGNSAGNSNSNANTTGNSNSTANTTGNLNRILGGGGTANGAGNANNGDNANNGGNADGAVNANANSDSAPTLDELKEDVDKIKKFASTYEDFGFSPLGWQQLDIWAHSFFSKETPWRDKDGNLVNVSNQLNLLGHSLFLKGVTPKSEVISQDCKPTPENAARCEVKYRPMSWAEWRDERKNDIKNLFGWFLMVLLLSVGAPFWQDTLESLFGVKNLLRKKSDTKNVETESGAGQPRP